MLTFPSNRTTRLLAQSSAASHVFFLSSFSKRCRLLRSTTAAPAAHLWNTTMPWIRRHPCRRLPRSSTVRRVCPFPCLLLAELRSLLVAHCLTRQLLRLRQIATAWRRWICLIVNSPWKPSSTTRSSGISLHFYADVDSPFYRFNLNKIAPYIHPLITV